MKTRLSILIDEYEKMFDEGKLRWRDLPRDRTATICPQNRTVALGMLDTFFGGGNIKVEIAEQELDDTQLFRIDDEEIPYLVIDPITQAHAWVDPSFKTMIPPDRAMAHFYSRCTGIPFEVAFQTLRALDKGLRGNLGGS